MLRFDFASLRAALEKRLKETSDLLASLSAMETVADMVDLTNECGHLLARVADIVNDEGGQDGLLRAKGTSALGMAIAGKKHAFSESEVGRFASSLSAATCSNDPRVTEAAIESVSEATKTAQGARIVASHQNGHLIFRSAHSALSNRLGFDLCVRCFSFFFSFFAGHRMRSGPDGAGFGDVRLDPFRFKLRCNARGPLAGGSVPRG